MSKKMNARQSFGYRVCTHLILFSFFCSIIIPSVAMDNGLQEQRKTKPVSMSALAWIQELERDRDVADKETFESLTNEISATIAGKYGIADRQATPEEQELIISSITRTRHRFMDEDNILSNRYLSYNPLETRTVLQTNSRFKDHMAAVLAIDSIVAKALNYDEFEEMWRQDNESKTISPAFVPSVIRHVKYYEERETAELFHQPLQRFLETNQDTIHLANDVFNTLIQNIRLAQNVQAEPSIMCGVMSGDIGTLIFKMLSFKDSIAYATSTAETYRSLSIWHNIRQIHFPNLDMKNIRGHREGNTAGLRTAIYLSIHAYNNFDRLFENKETIIDDVPLMERIRTSFTPQFVRVIRGCALMIATNNPYKLCNVWCEAERFEEAVLYLSQTSEESSPEALQRLSHEAYLGDNGNCFDNISGRTYLETRARDRDDQHAQKMLNDAASHRQLGFDDISGREYLEDRVRDHHDQDAQKMINLAAIMGRLGFDAMSGREYLERRASDHNDRHAQEGLNQAANKKIRAAAAKNTFGFYLAPYGDLGFNKDTGCKYLKARASRGCQDAQKRLSGEITDVPMKGDSSSSWFFHFYNAFSRN